VPVLTGNGRAALVGLAVLAAPGLGVGRIPSSRASRRGVARRTNPRRRSDSSPSWRRPATGLTNREVAKAAFVSTKTVEANLARAYRKLGIRSRAELAGP
jgi:hypothetical protein